MRSPLVLVLVLLLLVGGAAAYLLGGGRELAPVAPPDVVVGGGAARDPEARVVEMPAGVVATRSREDAIEADVADQPTACLRILDMANDRPLAGAIVRLVQNGADVSFSDEHGYADVPLKKAAQLAVALDGYLLRLAPTSLGSTRADPQVVRLVRDDWSIVRAFAFVDAQGRDVDDVFVRFAQPEGTDPPAARVPQDDPIKTRAWTEHTMLARREVGRDAAVQLVGYRHDVVHRLGSGDLVRFTGPGTLSLEAATATGLVGRATVEVLPGPRPPALRVQLVPGAFVSGHVRDLDGAPLGDAEVTVRDDELLGLVATTTADGAFSIGPLPAGDATLLVRHGLYEPLAHGPVRAPSEDVVVRLRPLARQPLRGRVVSRAGDRPLAGAIVVWQAQGSDAIRAETAADGTFALRSIGDVAGTLRVQARDHLAYAELVEPGAAFADYAVLPADTATRLAEGMTATMEGVVQGRDGAPAQGVAVRWRPARATPPNALPGRRVLDGAVLDLPLVTTTGSDGAFVLETTQFGQGRLSLVEDPDNAVDLEAVAGRTASGLKFTR